MEGWLKAVPGWNDALSKEHMAEATLEYANLFNEIRAFRRRRDRIASYEMWDQVHLMDLQGKGLASQVRYAMRSYLNDGLFDCYFQVASGSVHTTIFCRTIGLHTLVSARPELAGVDREDVKASGYRMCSHCMKRTPEQKRQKVIRFCEAWISYLETPMAPPFTPPDN